MASTIKVSNISSQTSDKELKDFFGFFGQIQSIDVTPGSSSNDSTKSATVTFVKESAAKTALLLDNTALGPSQLKVESATASGESSSRGIASPNSPTSGQHSSDEHYISQDDKPRSAQLAELLSQGYMLGDTAIAKALALDEKHGISQKFTQTLQNYNAKYQATSTAKGMDNKYGVTDKAMGGWATLNHYFEQALGTPTGQTVRSYYSTGSKQVLDVHNEARRLADLKKQQQHPESASSSSATQQQYGSDQKQLGGVAGAGTGATAASGEQGAFVGGSGSHAEKMNLHQIGEGKTACDCAGQGGICACEAGKCGCGKGCAKDLSQTHVGGTSST